MLVKMPCGVVGCNFSILTYEEFAPSLEILPPSHRTFYRRIRFVNALLRCWLRKIKLLVAVETNLLPPTFSCYRFCMAKIALHCERL